MKIEYDKERDIFTFLYCYLISSNVKLNCLQFEKRNFNEYFLKY